MILAFVIPGAGHFYLGKRQRAVIFFLIVLFMFLMGIWLDGKLYTVEKGKPLTLLAGPATMGAGLIYLLARLAGVTGDLQSITYEYGTAFILTAGLMNLLLILDSFDISEGRKG
jgi:hypothetical protein